jgi:hypothetical protein
LDLIVFKNKVVAFEFEAFKKRTNVFIKGDLTFQNIE